MEMDTIEVKQENIQHSLTPSSNTQREPTQPVSVIDLSSSDSDSDESSSSSDDDVAGVNGKRSRVSNGGPANKRKKLDVVLPLGFLDPLPGKSPVAKDPKLTPNVDGGEIANVKSCKQFWKAGDFDEGNTGDDWETSSGGMDHVRVHPRFLHSNATSHKWVLGAFAELLDNSLDEVCNGSTYVNIDMIKNKKDDSRMLLIEDNGGGMDPDKMRQCMSLGYSLKSKVADTIGQYGNGFKTSTMRLGADVIVFSRCAGKDGKRPTQSIGLLSYTFLRSTGKEDIVVPMLDYERSGQEWNKLTRSSAGDWNINAEAIVQWSPFSSEADLLRQFNHMKERGTRIIIYNLWEDDQGLLELDFDSDQHDIQIRGVNRDEKNIQMAQQFPNSRHFLTYRHSLRSYASILYLRIPPGFRIILRGKDVEHHNIVNDMMMTQAVTYRPQPGGDGVPKDSNMVAVVTMGFVKDAKSHIDVQGFNVYHKNRLIKPFWRVWNAAGSDGRGVIGVLEANFVEPAHDKQGFERTTVLSRLEVRLVQMQKTYWSTYCHKIGYAPRRSTKNIDDREFSPDYLPQSPSHIKKKSDTSSSKAPGVNSDKFSSYKYEKPGGREAERHPKSLHKSNGNGHLYGKGENRTKIPTRSTRSGKGPSSLELSSPSAEDTSDDDLPTTIPERRANGNSQKASSGMNHSRKDGSRTIGSPTNLGHTEAEQDCYSGGIAVPTPTPSQSKDDGVIGNQLSLVNCNSDVLEKLKEENHELQKRLIRKEEESLGNLLQDLQYERERCKSLESQLQEATRKIEELNKEQESLIDIFSEERERRDIEEENLRKKLKDASNTIQELVDKVRLLEKMKSPSSKLSR